jgi:GPH family glycoside/pentoside/hexuronide:cation symporter
MRLYFDEIDVAREPLYVALAAGIVGGVVLWVKRRDAWGVKTCVRLLSLLFAIGCFTILLFGKVLLPTALGFFLFGIGFAGGMYLILLMNGDVVDMDEHRTGLRREGMYAGINSFITKPAISLAQAALVYIMAAYGYNQMLAKGLQSASAEMGLLIGWVAPTGVLLFLCFILLHWYPLAGPAWEQIKRDLAAVHAQKEKQYLERMGFKYVE